MATTVLGTVLRSLRRQEKTGLTDGELLECFITQRDEAAFEALLRRHGPMVLGVCRRVLRNEADAEDAFQATFLVLVRKAESVRPRGMVGNWLYGVAHSTALKARAMSTKRFAKEQEAAARRKPEVKAESWERLQALLDQELNALPEKYRAAIVLCDLEGKSLKDAARQLGCPLGTVGTRLVRGRGFLSRRLARHGFKVSGGVIAALCSQNATAAMVPPLLLNSTLKAATSFAAEQAAAVGVISPRVAALTEGVVQAMFLTKRTMGMMVLLVLIGLGSGAGLLTHSSLAAGKQETPRDKRNLAVAFAAPEAVQAAQADTPQAIIEKAIKAHGGADVLRKFKATQVKVKGKMEFGGGIPFTVVATTQLPDKSKDFMTMVQMGIEASSTSVFNGKQAWANEEGKTWELKDKELEAMRQALYHARVLRLVDLKDKAFELSLLGEQKVNGKDAVGVRVASKGHRDINLYFDKTTWLIVKTQVRGFDLRTQMEVDVETFLSDHQKVNGIMTPKKQVMHRDGKKFRETEVEEIKFLEKVDDSEFAKP